MRGSEQKQNDEALIGRLLRAAGRGPTASTEARERIYNSAHAEWRSAVAATGAASHRGEPRGRSSAWLGGWTGRVLAVAASLGLIAVLVNVAQSPSPQTRTEIGTVARSLGTVAVAGADTESGRPAGSVARLVHSGDTLTTGADGAVSLRLTDGPVLRLDSGSELLLSSAERIELRRGAAYLDTGPGADTTENLQIETPFGSVRHLGTQYEVRLSNDELRIRVREGAVEFRDASDPDRQAYGQAGEQLTVAQGAPPSHTAIATSGPEWAWAERLATAPAADELPVAELLDWIARETGRTLEFSDDSVAQAARAYTLSGFAGFTPAETLEVIGSTTELRYELTGDTLLIR